ncbi:MAG: arsenate reductase ArsC [Rhodobacteraceae bacterium]|nr:arsenate reductase ArsC [Paracoccaceae bacterium]
MNVLILCTGNSARSILLESILHQLSHGKITAFSAGSQPIGRVNPAAMQLLAELGHETSGLRSKSWDEFSGDPAPEMDIVITVCGNARDEDCPIWPGRPMTAHWGVDDPAKVTEPPEAIDRAFRTAYEQLRARAVAFLMLDLEAMTASETAQALQAIGRGDYE